MMLVGDQTVVLVEVAHGQLPSRPRPRPMVFVKWSLFLRHLLRAIGIAAATGSVAAVAVTPTWAAFVLPRRRSTRVLLLATMAFTRSAASAVAAVAAVQVATSVAEGPATRSVFTRLLPVARSGRRSRRAVRSAARVRASSGSRRRLRPDRAVARVLGTATDGAPMITRVRIAAAAQSTNRSLLETPIVSLIAPEHRPIANTCELESNPIEFKPTPYPNSTNQSSSQLIILSFVSLRVGNILSDSDSPAALTAI